MTLDEIRIVLAKSYGFQNWDRLQAHIEGASGDRLRDAVRRGDAETVRRMLATRPDLAGSEGALQLAVIRRDLPVVQLLVQHGANPYEGVYPHRQLTTSLAIARERGYDDVVAVLETARPPESGIDSRIPVDMITAARAAIDAGDLSWFRAQHAAGKLENLILPQGGLLTLAVLQNRPEVLELLLDLGFDPDERFPIFEGEFSWGMPLWHCAGSGQQGMAALLLSRGADPNAQVYASGDPLFQAYSQQDQRMIALLEQHGAVPKATTPGLFRLTGLAGRMLQGEAPYSLDGVGGDTLEEQLLWGAACGGDPEILRMVLPRIVWDRHDPRWFSMLEQPLRIWTHGKVPETWDRATYPICFALLLERCDPNLQGRFGCNILHSIAASRPHLTAAERVEFAGLARKAGTAIDKRDELRNETPLDWARALGREELFETLS